MSKGHTYESHQLNENGNIPWTDQENEIWSILIKRQDELLEGRACKEFIEGRRKLNFSKDRAPQLSEINNVLNKTTGWSVEAVPAVIPVKEFFTLLAHKKFPAATFIRKKNELKYIQEPDIFHELYGHCPLLTNQAYADFVLHYGKMALEASPKIKKYLFRIFWHTIEFGLVKTDEGMRIYGGGILSSPEEIEFCLLKENEDKYYPYDTKRVLRTPFRIDILQDHYFVLKNFNDLFDLSKQNLIEMAQEAIELGDYPPTFEYDREDNNARYN